MSYQRTSTANNNNPPMPDRSHLDELLEAVKKEFDSLSRETTIYKDHHHEYEVKISQQHQELTNISNTVYELEQAHRSMKEAYEREIMKLKQELEARDRLLEQHSLQQQAVAVAQAHAQAHAQNNQNFTQTPQLPPPILSSVSPTDSRSQNNAYSNGLPQISKPDLINSQQLQQQQLQQLQQPTDKSPLPTIVNSIPNSISPNANGRPTINSNTSGSFPLNDSTSNNTANNASASTTTTLAPIGAKAASSSSANPSPPINYTAATPISSSAAAPVPPPAAATNGTPSTSDSTPSATNKQLVKTPTTEEIYLKRAQHNKPIPAFLKDFDSYNSLPYKKQHSEYYLVYNPKVPKKVDISLVHSFDHTSVVCCVRFSKDGKFLATGCNKLTQVFSVETGDLVARLNDEASISSNGAYDTDTGDLYIRSVCFSPDGKFLATGAEDKIIRIWDLATRTIVKYLKGHEQDIYSLDFFPDGTKLVSGSGDRTVRIWDVFTGQCCLTLSIEDGVTTVAVSPDGSLIAAGSLDRTVRVWDANKGYLVERLDSSNESGNGHMDSVYSVTFTNQGKEIASGSLDRTVKLWSLKDLDKQPAGSSKSNCEVTYVGHKDFVLSVCCTPDDEFILSGSKDRGVIMWDKKSGEPYIMLQGHRNSVISVSVSPVINAKRDFNGGYFATGSGDCKARIWKWERVSPDS